MAQGSIVLMACGSFSPPTPMHFRMFEIAKDYFTALGTHSVIGGIVSPVHDAYGKKDLVSASHRCAMLRLALRSSQWIKLSDWEVNQEGWTRTRMALKYHQETMKNALDGFRHSQKVVLGSGTEPRKPPKPGKDYNKNYINAYLNDQINNAELEDNKPSWLPDGILNRTIGNSPDITDNAPSKIFVDNGNDYESFSNKSKVQLRLLCGADLLESFATPGLWADEDLEAILGEHGLVVITRNGNNPEKFIYDSDVLTRFRRNITIVTNWVPNEVSSTMIRRLLRRGESVKYLIDEAIISYITQNQLYGCNSHNIKYLKPFSTHKPPTISTASPSPNDVIMKSPSEFRMQRDENVIKTRNTHISSKIINYLIGVDEIDSNDVYTSSSQPSGSHFKEKRSRLTNKVSASVDLSPKSFCGDVNQNINDSSEGLRPRKSVKVITDLSGVHKVVGGKGKVCETDLTDEVFIYCNGGDAPTVFDPGDARINLIPNGRKHSKDDILTLNLAKLNIGDELPQDVKRTDSPRSPLRSYDEIVKFIFSEHGIQVISDRETIV